MAQHFNGFAALRAHVSRTEASLKGAMSEGIELASEEILDEVQQVIGHYQSAKGPYPA